jgi:hypothetical protein
MGNSIHRWSKMENALVINYMIMRRALGFLGILFPLILVIGSLMINGREIIQDSISEYYYTGMRNGFVGVLCCMALFLFSYKGYPGSLDNILGNIGGLAALGVAFCQCGPDKIWRDCHPLTSNLHYISAAILFIIFGLFSLFLFTRTDIDKAFRTGPRYRRKKIRNIIYKVCGIIILLSISALFVLSFFDNINCKYGFWLESVALVTFGFSWTVKGGLLFQDLHHHPN